MKNILLLDSEGKRVAVKYFSDDWPTHAAKLAFEKSVFTKTLKTNARTEGDAFMIWLEIQFYVHLLFCRLHESHYSLHVCLCEVP